MIVVQMSLLMVTWRIFLYYVICSLIYEWERYQAMSLGKERIDKMMSNVNVYKHRWNTQTLYHDHKLVETSQGRVKAVMRNPKTSKEPVKDGMGCPRQFNYF